MYFPGVRLNCTKVYLKLSLKANLDHFILNIDFVKNKFESRNDMVKGNKDILMTYG